jgi:hypothetical protein
MFHLGEGETKLEVIIGCLYCKAISYQLYTVVLQQ